MRLVKPVNLARPAYRVASACDSMELEGPAVHWSGWALYFYACTATQRDMHGAQAPVCLCLQLHKIPVDVDQPRDYEYLNSTGNLPSRRQKHE